MQRDSLIDYLVGQPEVGNAGNIQQGHVVCLVFRRTRLQLAAMIFHFLLPLDSSFSWSRISHCPLRIRFTYIVDNKFNKVVIPNGVRGADQRALGRFASGMCRFNNRAI